MELSEITKKGGGSNSRNNAVDPPPYQTPNEARLNTSPSPAPANRDPEAVVENQSQADQTFQEDARPSVVSRIFNRYMAAHFEDLRARNVLRTRTGDCCGIPQWFWVMFLFVLALVIPAGFALHRYHNYKPGYGQPGGPLYPGEPDPYR